VCEACPHAQRRLRLYRHQQTIWRSLHRSDQQSRCQHREGTGSRFTSKYRTDKLVYFEHYPSIEEAIAREKAIKAWKRMWKVRAIEEMNPSWDDLYGVLLG